MPTAMSDIEDRCAAPVLPPRPRVISQPQSPMTASLATPATLVVSSLPSPSPITPLTPSMRSPTTPASQSFFASFKLRMRRKKRRSRQSFGTMTLQPTTPRSTGRVLEPRSPTVPIKDSDAHELDSRYQRYLTYESTIVSLTEHVEKYIKSFKDLLYYQSLLATDLLFFHDISSQQRSSVEKIHSTVQSIQSDATNNASHSALNRLLSIQTAVREMRDEFSVTKKRMEQHVLKRTEHELYAKKIVDLRAKLAPTNARLVKKEEKLKSFSLALFHSHRSMIHALEPFKRAVSSSIVNVPFCELFDATMSFHSLCSDRYQSLMPIISTLDDTPVGEQRDLDLTLDFDCVDTGNDSDEEVIIDGIPSRPSIKIVYRNPAYDDSIPFAKYHEAFNPALAFSFERPHEFQPPSFMATGNIKSLILTRNDDACHTHSHLYRQSRHGRQASLSITNPSVLNAINPSPSSPIPPPRPVTAPAQTSRAHSRSVTASSGMGMSVAVPSPSPSPPPVPARIMSMPVPAAAPSAPVVPMPAAAAAVLVPKLSVPPPLPQPQSLPQPSLPPPLPNSSPHTVPPPPLPSQSPPPTTAPPTPLARRVSQTSPPGQLRRPSNKKLSIETAKRPSFTTTQSLTVTSSSASFVIESSRRSPRQSLSSISPSSPPIYIHRLRRTSDAPSPSPSPPSRAPPPSSRSLASSQVIDTSISPVFTVHSDRPGSPMCNSRGSTQRSAAMAARMAMFEAKSAAQSASGGSPRHHTSRSRTSRDFSPKSPSSTSTGSYGEVKVHSPMMMLSRGVG